MSVGIAVKLCYLETAKLFLRDCAKKAKGLSEEMARITLFVPSTIAMLNRNMEGLLEELRVFDKSHADFFAAMSRLELMPAGVKEMKQKMSEYIAVIWEIRKDLDKRATTPEKEFLTNTQLQQDLRQDFKAHAEALKAIVDPMKSCADSLTNGVDHCQGLVRGLLEAKAPVEKQKATA